MSFAKKILSPLRNAFSYAAHLESAADHARKAESVEKLVARSPVPEAADDGYARRLRETLMKTRTKHLDTLVAENVGVVLDTRLAHQRLDGTDQRIDGIFYDKPGARTVALWDHGISLPGWKLETPAMHGPAMLERLAMHLREGMRGDMYASRYTAIAHAPGAGAAACVTYTGWKPAALFDAATVAKNPALRTPLKNRAAAPKP